MRLGVFGESGAGKSTLMALAPRLYDLPGTTGSGGKSWGAVYFDGYDVRDLKLADLRRAVSLVPQQALLFEGTIRTNLLYANLDATEDQMREALLIADLAETVASLPGGLDTPVGERGYSLSGGQRQRLALARAIVAQPAVLLLDDCTSALDAETEARIQLALDRDLPGRTCLIVSHKVASVARRRSYHRPGSGSGDRAGNPLDFARNGRLLRHRLPPANVPAAPHVTQFLFSKENPQLLDLGWPSVVRQGPHSTLQCGPMQAFYFHQVGQILWNLVQVVLIKRRDWRRHIREMS